MLAGVVTAAVQMALQLATAMLHVPNPVAVRFVVTEDRRLADVMNRVFSFDDDGDDRIARHELPERMQGLVARADRDGNGFLTSAEIRMIAAQRRAAPDQADTISSRRNPANMIDVVSDLRLPEPKRKIAIRLAVNDTIPWNPSNPESIGRRELWDGMRKLLDDEEYGNFEAAARRLRSEVVMD